MHKLSVDAVFDEYERIRDRLVAARFPSTSRRATGLIDVADDFDAFVFDSYGVLNIGERAIAGAAACIKQLRAMGKPVIVLTNAASYPLEVAMARYQRFGFDFTAQEVVSSRAVAITHMAEMAGPIVAICETIDALADFGNNVIRWDATDVDNAAGFLLMSRTALTPDTLAQLEEALRRHPRPVYVANPDLVAPREDGLYPEPGLAVHRLIDTLGIAPQFYGKPFGNAFDAALARLPDIAPARILMVGDTLHTDILGGAAAGLRTALVTDHGIMAGHDTAPFIARSGIVPDVIVPSI